MNKEDNKIELEIFKMKNELEELKDKFNHPEKYIKVEDGCKVVVDYDNNGLRKSISIVKE